MATVEVYRVEHRISGFGPFGHDTKCKGLSQQERWRVLEVGKHINRLYRNTPSLLDVHPGVWVDFPGIWDSKLLCAAPSLAKLRDWFFFDGLLAAMLEEAGFILAIYEVEEEHIKCGKSGSQVAFPPAVAVRKVVLPLSAAINSTTNEENCCDHV